MKLTNFVPMALLWAGLALSGCGRFSGTFEAANGIAAVSFQSGKAFVTLMGDTQLARDFYEMSLAEHPTPSSVWLKLSDVYFKLAGPVQPSRDVNGASAGREPSRSSSDATRPS